jgi:hypothetical protein
MKRMLSVSANAELRPDHAHLGLAYFDDEGARRILGDVEERLAPLAGSRHELWCV